MKFLPLILSFFLMVHSIEKPADYRWGKNPVQGQDPLAICESNVVTIPLKRAGRLLLIEAQVDSLKGNFIFDTGAPYLVLNRTYFRDYKKRNSYNASGITAEETVDLIKAGKLNIKNINYTELDADRVNLGEIENVRGIKILGLLGLNLFKGFEMEIDVRNSVLKLYKLDEKGDCLTPPSAAGCEIEMPISVRDNTVFTECTIAGKQLRFGFDSGAETNALSSRVNKKVLETISITGRRSLMGVGDESVEILFGRMNDFQIDGQTVLGMQTLITQLDGMDAAYGTQIDGMLGFDFMAKGVVRINCRKNYLRLCIFDKFSSQ